MAFVQSPIDPQQQNQLGPQGQTTPNPLALLPPQATQTGGSAGQGGGQAGGTAPSVGTSTQFGSNASRLSDYLQANKDQVQQMANQIAGQMGTQYQNLQQGIGQAGQQFGQSVSGGYTPQDPSLLSQVQSNPTAAAANPQSVSEFRAMANDQYTGPTSFEASTPYANVQKQVNNAVQQSQLLGTYPGLSQYLQGNIEQNPTPGQNTLDTTLLQMNPTASQTIQTAGQPFANLTGQLSTQAQAQDQAVQQAEQNAQATARAAQAALGTAGQNFTGNVNQELANAEQGFTGGENALNSYIAALQKPGLSGVTPQLAGTLGINPYVESQYTGVPTVMQEMQSAWSGLPNLGTMVPGANDFTFPTAGTGPTAAGVATPQDYATLTALTALGGGMPPPNSPIAAATAGQAGTYQQPNFTPTPNNPGLAKDLMSYLQPWASPPGVTPIGSNQGAATADYAKLMNNLASYLGLPAFNPSYPTSPQATTPTGPPFLGTGGGRGI